ncbi:MAG: phage terminase large subunit [Alphaproteobacteria bacterium]
MPICDVTDEQLTDRQKAANRLLAGSARHVLLRGGSRSGKTFVLVRALFIRALKGAGSRHGIVRSHKAHVVESVWMDTLPKVLSLCFPGLSVKRNETLRVMTLPNAAEIWVSGLDDKDRVEKILGKEFCTLFFNECSQIRYDSVLVALTRLAQNVPGLVNKAYYDCNPPPRSHWTYKIWKEGVDPVTGDVLPQPDLYAEMRINPVDNARHVAPDYLETLQAMPQRERMRFLEGEWGDSGDGALWTQAVIDKARVEDVPELERIGVAVDPAVTASAHSNETGIIVGGLGRCEGRAHAFVLHDASIAGTPDQWARRAVGVYHAFEADVLVVETNQGGDMVMNTIRTIDPSVSIRQVRASRGKVARAEPVSALYEQGRVHHVGHLKALEDQMLAMTVEGYRSEGSPDRVDALVWLISELMPRMVYGSRKDAADPPTTARGRDRSGR